MILANTQKGFAHDYLLFISFVLNQIKVCYNLIRRSCESIDLVYLEFDWLNDLGSRASFWNSSALPNERVTPRGHYFLNT